MIESPLEQVAWSKEAFIKRWDMYRPGGAFSARIKDPKELKGYEIVDMKTGRNVAWVVLYKKAPSQIKEGHLAGYFEHEKYGWTAKELVYEEVKI